MYRMKMYLFGVLPLGWQELSIRATRTTEQATLTDVGPGFAVKLWDHNVVLTKQGDSKTERLPSQQDSWRRLFGLA